LVVTRDTIPRAVVFREGAENCARGGRAPFSISGFRLKADEIRPFMALFPHPDSPAGGRALRQPGMAADALLAGILLALTGGILAGPVPNM
jgi:hypothetical protein